MFENILMIINCNLLIEYDEQLIAKPSFKYNSNEYTDLETYERERKAFKECFKAALKLIHNIISQDFSLETTDGFSS